MELGHYLDIVKPILKEEVQKKEHAKETIHYIEGQLQLIEDIERAVLQRENTK